MTGVRVVGIDLALASTGVARADVDEAGVSWRTWQVASPKHGSGTARQAARISGASRRILAATLDEDPWEGAGHPDLVVIEGLPPGTYQQGVRDVAGQWWMVTTRLVELGIPVAVCMPSTLKVYALGHGGSKERPAGKPQMLAAAHSTYPGALTGGVHDVADALFLAAAGARWAGFPVDCLPDQHLRALDKFKWPESFRPNRIGAVI